eukprot:g21737.t1
MSKDEVLPMKKWAKALGKNADLERCLLYYNEQDLLIMQYHYGIGIFACDTFAIYSSVSMELAPGVLTRRVTSTLLGELGGSFLTVLNLGAFMQVWKQVLWDGEYLHHDWILKVDPDTVFLVNRLRPILANYNEEMGPSGIYLNNCKDGMHGPLEVFSRSAIMQLANTSEYCAEKLDGGKPCQKDCDKFWDITYRGHCNGPCTKWWGEDPERVSLVDMLFQQSNSVSKGISR